MTLINTLDNMPDNTISESSQKCIIEYKFNENEVSFSTWHEGFLSLTQALAVPQTMYFRELMKNLSQQHVSYAMSVLTFVRFLTSRYVLDVKPVDFYQMKQGSSSVEVYVDKLQRCSTIAGIKEDDLIDHCEASLRDEISIVLISSQFGSWVAAKRAALDIEKRLGNKEKQSSGNGYCFHCKITGHFTPNCPIKNKVCSKCKVKGHMPKIVLKKILIKNERDPEM
eukprot:NODE_189_length_13483_cov_0.581067.p4 type:complete len:225 gc:universal NODE_189_length_13483_cov_0.581067:3549-4223(+)